MSCSRRFYRPYRSASTYRGDSSVRSWLLTITRNAALRMYKREAQRRDRSETLMELGRAAGWGQSSPESLAERAQDRDALRTALHSLPEAAGRSLFCESSRG